MLRIEQHIPENEPTADDLLEFAAWCDEMESGVRESRDEAKTSSEAFDLLNLELIALDPVQHRIDQRNKELLTVGQTPIFDIWD